MNLKSHVMKKIIILLFAAGFAFSVAAQPVHYEITGLIQGAEGETFLLFRLINGKPAIVDSAISLHGVFKMNAGSLEFPEMVNLTVPDKKQNITFFLENKKITIQGKLDSLNQARVTGSKTQDELVKYRASLDGADKKREKLVNDFQNASAALMNEIKTIQIDFIKNNPGSYAVPQLLKSLYDQIPATDVEFIVKNMDPTVAATPVMKEIAARMVAEKAVAIGMKAPDFTLNDVTNVPVTLSSLKKHKLLLIDFWAAWCKPCRAENPNVVRIYNEFHSKGFDILGVSLDRKMEDWVKAITEDRLSWRQVSDLKYFNGPVTKKYNINSIPANFLLDENGIIVAKNLTGEELYKKVKSVVGAE